MSQEDFNEDIKIEKQDPGRGILGDLKNLIVYGLTMKNRPWDKQEILDYMKMVAGTLKALEETSEKNDRLRWVSRQSLQLFLRLPHPRCIHKMLYDAMCNYDY